MTNIAPLHQMTLAEARAKAEAINYDPNWTVDQLMAATAHMSQAEKAELGHALRIVGAAMQQEANELWAEAVAREPKAVITLADAQAKELNDAHSWLASIDYSHVWTADTLVASVAGMSDQYLYGIEHALQVVAADARRKSEAVRSYIDHRGAAA